MSAKRGKGKAACAAALLASALLLSLGRAVRGEPPGETRASADVELASQNDADRLQAARAEAIAQDEKAVSDLEQLLAKTAQPRGLGEARNAPGDGLVPPAAEDAPRLVPLRIAVLDAAAALPAELRKKLVQAQDTAAATERSRGLDDEEALLRRFPCASGASELARKLAERAFEEGDFPGAASLDRLALRLERLRTGAPAVPSPGALVRRAVSCIQEGDREGCEEALRGLAQTEGSKAIRDTWERVARERAAAREARRPPEKVALEPLASYPFVRPAPKPAKDGKPDGKPPEDPAASPTVSQAPVAAHTGDLVFASDGVRILAVDARTGELKGRLPHDDEGAPAGGVPGSVSTLGDLVVSPLFLEGFLSPAREGALERGRPRETEEGDPTLRGGFLSLCAFDARALRLLWWDGDAGREPRAAEDAPRGRPEGAALASDEDWRRLARGHVAGRPLLDGRRIYAPLATAGNESQVWVAAWERATGDRQALALVPAWCTYITSAVQQRGPGQPPSTSSLAPSNPKLALDPDGRVIVETELGIVTALDARTGSVEWVARLREPEQPGGGGRFGRAAPRGPRFQPSSDPPVVVPSREGKPGVVVLAPREEGRFVALSLEDGSVVWVAPFRGFDGDGQESPRVRSLDPEVVLGYGGRVVVFLEGRTGRPFAEVPLRSSERAAGPCARAGDGSFLLPLTNGRARVVTFRITRTAQGVTEVAGALRDPDPIPLREAGEEGPWSLLCLEERLVVTTPSKVQVFAWKAWK